MESEAKTLKQKKTDLKEALAEYGFKHEDFHFAHTASNRNFINYQVLPIGIRRGYKINSAVHVQYPMRDSSE